MIQFTCIKNIGNLVKQCENLKKILKGVNTYCFSTIPAKICEKQKFQILKVVLALNPEMLSNELKLKEDFISL